MFVVCFQSDDIPLSCGGLLAKLVAEGYKGWLIQTTNDMMCGPTPSVGETILQNEREVEALAAALGLETPVINFGCKHPPAPHPNSSSTEISDQLLVSSQTGITSSMRPRRWSCVPAWSTSSVP